MHGEPNGACEAHAPGRVFDEIQPAKPVDIAINPS